MSLEHVIMFRVRPDFQEHVEPVLFNKEKKERGIPFHMPYKEIPKTRVFNRMASSVAVANDCPPYVYA